MEQAERYKLPRQAHNAANKVTKNQVQTAETNTIYVGKH